MKKFAGLVCMTIAALATGSAAQAASFGHIDQLAVQMEQQVKQLTREIHLHYRNTPVFAHLDRDAHEMEELAEHIHELVHHGANINHIAHDVEKLDQHYHHMEQLVGMMRGYDLRHIRRSMAVISQTLHHLRQDVAEMRAPQHHHNGYGRPRPRSGINFSGNGWTIRFGR